MSVSHSLINSLILELTPSFIRSLIYLLARSFFGVDGVQEAMVGTTGDADSTPTTEEVAVTEWSMH